MHISLVLFTVIAQMVSGSVILREIAILSGRASDDQPTDIKRSTLILPLLFLVSGLVIAFFHLGYPLNSLNAVRNLKTSWLSREILFFGMLTASVSLSVVTSINRPGRPWRLILSVINIIFASALMFSMVMVYMLPSVKSWYSPFTPVAFLFTAVLTGTGLLNLADRENRLFSSSIYAILLLVFTSAALIFTVFTLHNSGYRYIFHFIIKFSSLLLLISILIRKISETGSNKRVSWAVIVLILLFLSEITGRYIFFLSFEKSGL